MIQEMPEGHNTAMDEFAKEYRIPEFLIEELKKYAGIYTDETGFFTTIKKKHVDMLLFLIYKTGIILYLLFSSQSSLFRQ